MDTLSEFSEILFNIVQKLLLITATYEIRKFPSLGVLWGKKIHWMECFVLALLCLCLSQPSFAHECDQRVISSDQGPREGVFRAPEIINPKRHSRQCTYIFTARKRERVQVQFNNFHLRGTPPECNHEYLDIYTEIKNPDNINLLKTAFGGRYCGRIPPRLRISLYRAAAIVFYTDYNVTYSDLFRGHYKFLNGSKYDVGTSGAEGDCGYIIHSDIKKSGVFLAPTYPGAYPKNISCYWKFVGRKGQRVRLEYRDFDLFYGGPHCPFDKIKIYDGPDQISPLIGTYCGQQRHLVIFSSGNSLMVTFTTLQRTADSQNRGFQSIFNFSESYLSLEFIHRNEAKENDAEHIRGTECDQKILSKGRSNGTVFSPSYPFPYYPKVVCRYFIYGLQDAQNLERVRLRFLEKFDIPAVPGAKSNCTNGFLRLYLQGQEMKRKYDSPDYELCGKTLPPSVKSLGPRLLMVFSSGSSQGIGFKASYNFETEYEIPGTPSPDGRCIFTYHSLSLMNGKFNSPRHPANYPSNTTCQFFFRPKPDEQVQVVFSQFKVRNDDTNHTFGNYCTEDYVELYNLYRIEGQDKEIRKINGRYCGQAMPGPIQNERDSVGLLVLLRTDHEGVYSGFDAEYLFKKKQPLFNDCGSNITNQEWGEITSPNWPERYGSPASDESFTCDWFIHVKQGHKVLIWFQLFAVEGNLQGRGCPAAVVRIWLTPESTPMELCGDDLSPEHSEVISGGPVLRLSFTTARKAVGADGFKIIWTDIQDREKCDEFLCSGTNFCISKNLKCNRYQNCGSEDRSDEETCTEDTEVNVLMLVGLGVGLSGAIVVVMCIWCHRKRARRREAKPLPHHVHVCERGARFANMDSTDHNLSPVLGTRKPPHHLSCASLRTETVV